MKLKVKTINFEAGSKSIVFMHREDVEKLGLRSLDRVNVKSGPKSVVAIIDVTTKFVKSGHIATNDEVSKSLKLKNNDIVLVTGGAEPTSVEFIKERLKGIKLNKHKMYAIVKDVVDKKLSDVELTAFVTSLYMRKMSMDEVEYLSRAMVDTGKKFKVPGRVIVDKHSCGGVPGDDTSMIVVPIIAAAGLTIPKTSSRAITSPSGTADRMEALAPVNLSAKEIIKVVKKTKGCIVWGGALDLAPADDNFIKVEYPLSIDPLMLPSIVSKKKSVGSKFIVIDIPTGRGAKIKTLGEARILANDFIELGKRLSMHISCAVTYGEQPIGYAIGPNLEAREVLETLSGNGPHDLIEKATNLAGIIFRDVRKGGKELAMKILKSGKAEKKMREIIKAQGGNPKIKPSDIPVGKKKITLKSKKNGKVLWIKNSEIISIARAAGAPFDRKAGIKLFVKVGSIIERGEPLLTIYSDNSIRLKEALKIAEKEEPIVVGRSLEDKMLLDKIPSKVPHEKLFMIER